MKLLKLSMEWRLRDCELGQATICAIWFEQKWYISTDEPYILLTQSPTAKIRTLNGQTIYLLCVYLYKIPRRLGSGVRLDNYLGNHVNIFFQ